MVITKINNNSGEHANSSFSVNLMPIVTGQSSEECCTLCLHSQGFRTF